MTCEDQTNFIKQRLSKQLFLFGELCEALTLRLLEIEERLSIFEKDLASKEKDTKESIENLLLDSQKHLNHVKGLLRYEVSKDLPSSRVLDKTLGNSNGKELLEVNQDSSDIDNQSGTIEESQLIETEYFDDPQTSYI